MKNNKKPQEILELEKIYGIELREISEKELVSNSINP
jgi:hypothetical protein